MCFLYVLAFPVFMQIFSPFLPSIEMWVEITMDAHLMKLFFLARRFTMQNILDYISKTFPTCWFFVFHWNFFMKEKRNENWNMEGWAYVRIKSKRFNFIKEILMILQFFDFFFNHLIVMRWILMWRGWMGRKNDKMPLKVRLTEKKTFSLMKPRYYVTTSKIYGQ